MPGPQRNQGCNGTRAATEPEPKRNQDRNGTRAALQCKGTKGLISFSDFSLWI